MKKSRKMLPALFSILAVVVLVIGGRFYISSVQNSLWMLSVTDLKQITAQASHAFEVYLQKDIQNIHGMALNLSKIDSGDEEYIKTRLEAYNDVEDSSFYTVVDMGEEVFYSTGTSEMRKPLPENRVDAYRAFSGSGIEEPYISEVNGLRCLASYECFTYADGVEGIVRRAVPISGILEEFSLSIYDGEGFSYIVNREGDILLRSRHKDSSHAYLNVFDIMSQEAEDGSDNQSVIDGFKDAMAEGKNGVVRFNTVDGENYVYAYVPIANTDGWYCISVVPNDVLMEQSNHILNISWLFLLLMVVSVFVLIVILVLMRKNRKAMEKISREVQYREQLFDILTNGTGDAFVMYTKKDKQVEYVSPNIEQLLGIPAEEIKSNVSVLREDEETDPAFTEGLAQLEEGNSFYIEQERVHRKTDERRWIMITVYLVNIEKTEKVIMVFSDRTVEKQKEHTLEEAMNVAETANRAKSTFLNNMSHDIRTPMNAIVGLCTLLSRDADNPERVRDYIRKITASSQHLLGLINDVLDMSKIEAGKTTLNITVINLAEMVEELNTILLPQAKAKQQTFEISVFDLKSERLLGDKLRINQILMNILSNAVKYTPEGGRIELTIRQLPQATKNFARIQFIVKDNGIGMAPEYLETIFEPFTREVNSNTNKIQGTGLGMTITKRLTDLMGGVVSVESTPGEGSTFTVDLELRIEEQDVHQDFWEKHGVTNLLVVDDEEDICENVIRTMEGTGVIVQSALDGLSAIRLVEQTHEKDEDFDLILLDWKMPGMDGIETARRIRKILPRDVTILVLTAYDWSDIEEEALAAGIDGYMPKPFFLSNFELTIERFHQEEQEEVKEDSDELKGLHILAAEDNDLNAEILKELLDMLGATCDIEENGEKAWHRFEQSQENEYDLILMDIQMPVMNGYEATRAIRACEHPQAQSIPIIAMTADAFAEDIKRALESGMNAHMAKPIDLGRLEEVVREVKGNGGASA